MAGALSSMAPLGTWWASVPQDRWPDSDALRDYLNANWEEPWGDRRQELVFIAAGIEWPVVKARLNSALMPEGVIGDDASIEDPFPIWRKQPSQG